MSVDYGTLKKSGFMRQKQKNKFSLRLKVVGGYLTAENIRAVAQVAETYGAGYIHMTSRQGVEIPYIDLKDIEAVKAELKKGRVVPGACGPRVRTVTACQGNVICPSGCIDAYDIAKTLDQRYFGRELPHKFKFGVTGCMNNCLKAEENDLGVKGGMEVTWNRDACTMCGVCEKVCRTGAITARHGALILDREKCNYCGRCVKSCPTDAWLGESGYLVYFGGVFGNHIHKGTSLVPFLKSRETLLHVADAAVDFFGGHALPGERFYFTLERVGTEKLRGELDRIVKEGENA